MRKPVLRAVARMLAAAVPSLAVATIAVAVLQDVAGVPNPSAIYLVAVVVTAFVAGTWGAIVAAVASFLLYDFLFVEPALHVHGRRPGRVAEPRPAALRRHRRRPARRAAAGAGGAGASRASARRGPCSRSAGRWRRAPSTPAVLPDDRGHPAARRPGWSASGSRSGRTTRPSGSRPTPAPGRSPRRSGLYHVLQRTPGDAPARWVRVHQTGAEARAPGRRGREAYRVRIEAAGRTLGSIWAPPRPRDAASRTGPRRGSSSAAADQVGQALAQDRLAAEAQAAEIARQSDALKSALLQSVSHDLRTPLATIRAAAGTLRPGSGLSEEDQRRERRRDRPRGRVPQPARDQPARPEPDRGRRAARRARRLRARRPRRPDARAAPARGSATGRSSVDLDGAAGRGRPGLPRRGRHQRRSRTRSSTRRPDAPIRVIARPVPGEARVRLTIEDGGPGRPGRRRCRGCSTSSTACPGTAGGSRSGTGIGLAVVRGLVEAMGGRVDARRSELGGLAIDIDLPVARGHRAGAGRVPR